MASRVDAISLVLPASRFNNAHRVFLWRGELSIVTR